MRKYIAILVMVVFIFSCRKADEVPSEPEKTPEVIDTIPVVEKGDTAFIGPYFPAYPKSIWFYVNMNGDTIIHKTDPGYTFLPAYWTGMMTSQIDRTPSYVTRYDGRPVKGYNLHTGQVGSQYTHGWQILLPGDITKNSVGLSFPSRYVVSGAWLYRKIEAVDTSIVVNNIKYEPVVVVKETHTASTDFISRIFYAKDVDIVKIDELKNDSIYDSEILISYKIGKK